jgi:hypothetical protein
VTLYFNEFNTEAGFDLLKIYDLQTQQVLAEYSGTYESGVPDPVTSPSGKMFLTFSTNSMNTAPGWVAYYESNLVNIAENEQNKNLIIFPNPTSGYLNIRNSDKDHPVVKLNLYDPTGRLVYTSLCNFDGKEPVYIDLRHISPGIYILSAFAEDGDAEFHRIIKD